MDAPVDTAAEILKNSIKYSVAIVFVHHYHYGSLDIL